MMAHDLQQKMKTIGPKLHSALFNVVLMLTVDPVCCKVKPRSMLFFIV